VAVGTALAELKMLEFELSLPALQRGMSGKGEADQHGGCQHANA